MSHWRSSVLSTCSVVALVCGCSEVDQTLYDHTWVASYTLVNSSSGPLTVDASGPHHSHFEEVAVGDSVRIADYSEFLAPEPELSRDLWCLTLSRPADGTVLAQYSPVEDAAWSLLRPREYHVEYTLVVRDEDLVGVAELCDRMEGRLVSAADSSSVITGVVALRLGLRSEGQFATDEGGRFGFWLPDYEESGVLLLYAQGYQLLEVAFPSGVAQVGTGVYGGDFFLAPIGE